MLLLLDERMHFISVQTTETHTHSSIDHKNTYKQTHTETRTTKEHKDYIDRI